MDEMKIRTNFMKEILSGIAKLILRKKIGYDIDIQLNDAAASFNGEKMHVHLDIDAELDRADLAKILKSIGIP